ncbi:hypothetical protein Slin_1482 [Spirosoma linguale DSM 74]|uniref:Uncharacterized protein n=1 Tax=Spirosoma linguale (strain ATCC 33905 / DSM 74 / LMG 10896 / Claus 1) TaxID=504472 RepID=D2QN48_SPILD|nr:hypothetical protein Slin_1482 [Spirosoma linguale DSM 74]
MYDNLSILEKKRQLFRNQCLIGDAHAYFIAVLLLAKRWQKGKACNFAGETS